jgi:Family of unknown function (DUF5681)
MQRVKKAATVKPANRRRQARKGVAVPNGEGTRFQKGCPSPNPTGRPKWAAFSQLARERLLEPVPNDERGRTHSEVLFDMAFARARKGDLDAAEFLLDRAEGKPVQSVNTQVTSVTPVEKLQNWYAQLSDAELDAKEKELLGLIAKEKQQKKLLPGATEPANG